MTSDSSELEALREFIEKLKNTQLPILVEGLKDKKALMKFGINNIHSLKKSLEQTVSELAENNKEIVLLTDLDEEGKELFAKLLMAFNRHGVKVNFDARKALLKTKVRQIEGVPSRIKNILNKR